jgi:uncharacterized protein
MAQYKCVKCGCEDFEKDEMRATGGAFAKMFDIQNKKFYTISCKKCGYTELYKRSSSMAGNIADWFIG